MRTAVAAQPRSVGAASVSVASDGTRSRIKELRQSGSLRLVFPRSLTTDVEAIIVNTSGGITGGDRFDLDLTAAQNASLTITTQAAERAYRAQPDEVGKLTTTLSVGNGAQLRWLPQELILFERCNLQRRLNIDLAPSARLLMVEPVVFGRAAMGETLQNVRFNDRIKIMRNSTPIYVDGMDLVGDAAAILNSAAIAGGAGAMCSVVMVSPDAEQQLDKTREMLPDTAGASLLYDDMLVIRMLATDSYELRRTLIPVLENLNQSPLPVSWRL